MDAKILQINCCECGAGKRGLPYTLAEHFVGVVDPDSEQPEFRCRIGDCRTPIERLQEELGVTLDSLHMAPATDKRTGQRVTIVGYGKVYYARDEADWMLFYRRSDNSAEPIRYAHYSHFAPLSE